MFFKRSERHKKFIEKYKNMEGWRKAWNENKKLWLQNIHVKPPLFPIIILEKYKDRLALDKVECFDDILKSHYLEYEWDCGEFFIDSRGNQYEVNYIYMYHPIGFVYPSKIKKHLSLSEVKDILRSVKSIKKIDEFLGCKSIEELIDKI